MPIADDALSPQPPLGQVGQNTEQTPTVIVPKVPDNVFYHPEGYGTQSKQQTSGPDHGNTEGPGFAQSPGRDPAPIALNESPPTPTVSTQGAIQAQTQAQRQKVPDAATLQSLPTQTPRTQNLPTQNPQTQIPPTQSIENQSTLTESIQARSTGTQVAATSVPTTFVKRAMEETPAPTPTQHEANLTSLPTTTSTSPPKPAHTHASAYAAIGVCLVIGVIAGFVLFSLRKKRKLKIAKEIKSNPDDIKPGPSMMAKLSGIVPRVCVPTRAAFKTVTAFCKRSFNTKTNFGSGCTQPHDSATLKLFVQSKLSLQSIMGQLKQPPPTVDDCSSVYSRRTDLGRSKFSQSIERVATLIKPFKKRSPASSLTTSSASTIADQPGTCPKPNSITSSSENNSFDGNQTIPSFTPSTFKIHAVEMDFNRTQEGHLKMEVGQSIKIYQVFDHGWVYGLNRDSGQEGLAPRACLSIWPTSRTESDITMFPGQRSFSTTSFGSSIPGTPTGRFYNQFSPT